MIGLIQRVKYAKLHINNQEYSRISEGILLLLGVEKEDSLNCAYKLADKVARLRIFEDQQGKMNLSLSDVQGQLMVVSQFTLPADTQKGNRPGFSNAAPPGEGERLYEEFINYYRQHYSNCETGVFGADMQIELLNDGPATFILNT